MMDEGGCLRYHDGAVQAHCLPVQNAMHRCMCRLSVSVDSIISTLTNHAKSSVRKSQGWLRAQVSGRVAASQSQVSSSDAPAGHIGRLTKLLQQSDICMFGVWHLWHNRTLPGNWGQAKLRRWQRSQWWA